MTASLPNAAPAYVAAMCRPRTSNAFGADGRMDRDQLDRNIDEFCRCIRMAADDHGARLILFPEFALTGYSPGDYRSWVEGGIAFPGPVSERIGEAARAANAYAVVQAPETHRAFPDRYFLSAAIIMPSGDVGMVHRKNYSLSLRTSPVEIHDRFVEAFGADALLPVLDTPIGTMGIAIAAEVHHPEATRGLAFKGAEIILNPIANAQGVDYLARPGAEVVRQVRAFENVAYLAMTNIDTGEVPAAVYDYVGASIGHEVADGLFTLATIDIGALRAYRATAGNNLLAQVQPELVEDVTAIGLWPRNTFAEAPAQGFDQLFEIESRVWREMCAQGRGRLP